MEFLNPGFLYALAALAIPVIIHLFNFRRFKKIPFTNVRFLREIKVQTTNHNRLKHLLILLARLLAVAFLVLAFTRPYIPENTTSKQDETGAVSVFIDNSFSMEGEISAGMMLEVAKNRAADISGAYGNTVRFQALTQDFEGRDQYLLSSSEFSKRAQDVDLSAKSRSLQSILQRQNDLLAEDETRGKGEIFVISDFQKSRYDFSQVEVDSTVRVNLVQLEPNSMENVFIDSVWFDTPVRKVGTSEMLKVRVSNTGSQSLSNVPIKLVVNGKQRAIGSFGMEGNSKIDTALYFVHETPGIKRLKVSIEDYPLTYDDDYFLSYEVFNQIDIWSIKPENSLGKDFLGAVFAGDSTYQYTSIPLTQIDYSQVKNQDLIVLNELIDIPSGLASEMKGFVEGGGTVWVIPSYESDLESYSEFLNGIKAGALLRLETRAAKVRTINIEHPLYRGIFEKIPRNPDLPEAFSYFKISRGFNSADDLMSFGNGDPFLTSYASGSGKTFVSTVALNSDLNNFSGHALFVASALRMAEMSRATAINSIDLGEGSSFNLPLSQLGTDMVFHLISEDGTTDIIPPHSMRNGLAQISPGPELNQAGNYHILLKEDTLGAVGINYQRSESDRATYTKDELKSLAETSGMTLFDGSSAEIKQDITKLKTGTELWKICLILALGFLLTEILLLRLLKS